MHPTITLETDVSNGEITEYMVVDGLSIDEVLEVVRAKPEDKGKMIAEFLRAKGVQIPVKLSRNTYRELNLLEEKEIPEFDLILVNREAVLLSLEKRGGGMLRVSETYATNFMPRFIRGASPQDRFVSLVSFDGGIKRGEKVLGAWLILIEIDAMEVFDAVTEFGPEVLPGLGKSHVALATRALQRITKDDPVLPFLVTYSGKKSFHCFWQFDRVISKYELDDFDKAKDFLYGELKRRDKETHTKLDTALLSIDKEPLFSGTAIGRIACRHAEPGRFPQVSWRTGHDGIVEVDKLIAATQPIIKHMGTLQQLAAMQRQTNVNTGYRHFTDKVNDNDLRAAFPDAKPRVGDGYAVRCPLHDDKTHSAFVSGTGFIYCSVCCDANHKYVARVRPGGRIEKC